MKKHILIALVLCGALLLVACTVDDVVVDKTTSDGTYVVQRPYGGDLEVIDPSVPAAFTQISLDMSVGRVDKIEKFRRQYYLLNVAQQKIFVINRADVVDAYLMQSPSAVNVVAVDFALRGLTPSDVCFPNATDAYVAYAGSNKIGILDLTNNQLSGVEIEVTGEPTCIAGAGNQVCVACYGANKVDIIDTRTNTVTKSISIAGQPKLVEFANQGSDIAVITSGGSDGAKLFVIDVASGHLTLERTLVSDAEVSRRLAPQACVATPTALYVACHSLDNLYGGVRIPTSNFRTSYTMLRNSCAFVGYSSIYNTLYFVEQTASGAVLSIFNAGNNSLAGSIAVGAGPVVVSD